MVPIFISDIEKWRRESTTRSLQTYLVNQNMATIWKSGELKDFETGGLRDHDKKAGL